MARLRLSQARPQLQAFKQLHDSIKQLMALKAAVAALAPRADTEAAAGVAAPAAAAAGGGRDDWQGPGSAAGAEFEELRQVGLVGGREGASASNNTMPPCRMHRLHASSCNTLHVSMGAKQLTGGASIQKQ